MKTEIKKLPKSELEIEFELTAEEFGHHFEHAIEHLKGHVKVDGFRPGQAPAKMVEDKLKPEMLLMEAGEHAVKHVYHDYVLENNLEPIGEPEVQILKIAKGNPFSFKVKFSVLPDIELPDYKEIAAKIKGKEFSVTEEEVLDALNYLQKTRAKFTAKDPSASSGRGDFVEITYQSKDLDLGKAAPQSGASLAPRGREVKDQFILGEGGMVKGFEENIEGMKAGEEKEFSVSFPKDLPAQAGNPNKNLAGNDVLFKVKLISAQKMELPEINDEFAKQLGSFDTLAALKTSMKEGITLEKTEAEKQRKRGEVLDRISETSKFEIPEKLVEYEQAHLLEDLKSKIIQTARVSFEEYLATIKKTEEEIKEKFKKEAEKRIKGFLILRQIGKQENIQVSEEEIAEEMKKVQKGEFDTNQLKEYAKGAIYNEKVFKFLEECQ